MRTEALEKKEQKKKLKKLNKEKKEIFIQRQNRLACWALCS